MDRPTGEIRVEEYDGAMLPGAVANPDQLRLDEPAVRFIRQLVDAKAGGGHLHGP